MRNRNEVVKLLTEAFPHRTHITEMERYFAKGLESSGPTVNEGNRMLTVQNLIEVQRKCGVRVGTTELHERESTMNGNNNPIQEVVWAPSGRRVGVASLP